MYELPMHCANKTSSCINARQLQWRMNERIVKLSVEPSAAGSASGKSNGVAPRCGNNNESLPLSLSLYSLTFSNPCLYNARHSILAFDADAEDVAPRLPSNLTNIAFTLVSFDCINLRWYSGASGVTRRILEVIGI